MKKLFIVEEGKTKVLEDQGFDNEKLLQDVLEKFPEFIALDDLGVVEPFIVIGREVATPAGYIDVLCIDGDGVLTVIETKLARNSQIRREVIGQVLEYVGQLSKWTAHDVIQAANKYFKSVSDQESLKYNCLFELISGPDQDGELELEQMYELIGSNLRKGRIKVVIASDAIPDTLKDTVTFINSFSNFDIYVFQIQSYIKDDLKIFAPAVYGYTSKVNTGVHTDKVLWDEDGFFKHLESSEDDIRNTIKSLYEFCLEHGAEIRWGTGKVSASFSMLVERNGLTATVFSLYYNESSSYVSVNFGTMKRLFPDEVLDNFRLDLNRLPGIEFPEQAITDGKYPTIRIDKLIKNANLEGFISAIKKLVAN